MIGSPRNAWYTKLVTDTAVVGTHARSVGVEDAGDAHIDTVMSVVRHRERFGEALRLVVDRTLANRVDVAPVGLALRMLEWIAVDLAGRGKEEPCPWRRANSSRLRVPMLPTSSVSIGRFTNSIGEAGLARCMTSVKPPRHRPTRRCEQCARSRRRRPRPTRSGRGRTGGRRCGADPVLQSSMQTTRSPRSISLFADVRADEAGTAGDGDVAPGTQRPTPS